MPKSTLALLGLEKWDSQSLGVLALLLLVSYLITNAIVLYLHKKRVERIEQKARELWGFKSDRPTPITVVTGFLGSGKTTLLNYILTSPDHGLKVARAFVVIGLHLDVTTPPPHTYTHRWP